MNIPLPEKGRKIKTEGDGLYIIISPKGMRKWQFTYRWEQQQNWIDLGKYPAVSIKEARKRAREKQYLVDQVVNPLAEPPPNDSKLTVGKLAEVYLDKWAKPRKKSFREDIRILNQDVLPYWKDRHADEIRKKDVIELLERMYNRGAPIGSNNTLRLIKKMFNFAVERDLLEFSAINGVKQLAKNRARDRVLSDEEIRKFWYGLDQSSMYEKLKVGMKLILVTGQRPGEVAKMSRSEINGSWWTIPGERVKNGKTQKVYLSALALELIGENSEEYVIKTRWDDKPIDSLSMAHALHRRGIEHMGIEYFRPHDLRRTAATGIARIGYSNEVIGRVLNHTPQGVTAIYNRYRYEDKMQEALIEWSEYLAEKVLKLPEKETRQIGIDFQI